MDQIRQFSINSTQLIPEEQEPVDTIGTPEPDTLESWLDLKEIIANAENNSVIDLEGRGFAPLLDDIGTINTVSDYITMRADSNLTIKNGYFSGSIEMDWSDASDELGDGWWTAPLPPLSDSTSNGKPQPQDYRDSRVYLQDSDSPKPPLSVLYPPPPEALDEYRLTFHKDFEFVNDLGRVNTGTQGADAEGPKHYPGYAFVIDPQTNTMNVNQYYTDSYSSTGTNAEDTRIVGFRVTSRAMAERIISAIGDDVNNKLGVMIHAGPNIGDVAVIAGENERPWAGYERGQEVSTELPGSPVSGDDLHTRLNYDSSGQDPYITEYLATFPDDAIYDEADAGGYIDIVFEEKSLLFNKYIHVGFSGHRRFARSTTPENGGLAYKEGYDRSEYYIDLVNNRIAYKPSYSGRPIKAKLPFMTNLFNSQGKSTPRFERCSFEGVQPNGGSGTSAHIKGSSVAVGYENLVTLRECTLRYGVTGIRNVVVDMENCRTNRFYSRHAPVRDGSRINRCKMTHAEDKSIILVMPGQSSTNKPLGDIPILKTEITNNYMELRGTAHGQCVSLYKNAWQNSVMSNNIMLTSGTMTSFQPASGRGQLDEQHGWYNAARESSDELEPSCRMENNIIYQWDYYQAPASGQSAFSFNGASDKALSVTEETNLRLTNGLNVYNANFRPFAYEFPDRNAEQVTSRPIIYGKRGQTYVITNESHLTESMNNEMSDCTNGNCTPCTDCTGTYEDCGQDARGEQDGTGRCRELGFYRAYIGEAYNDASGYVAGLNNPSAKTDVHTLSEVFYDEYGDVMDEFDSQLTHKQVLTIKLTDKTGDFIWLNSLTPSGQNNGAGQAITVKPQEYKVPRVYIRNNLIWMDYETVKDTFDNYPSGAVNFRTANMLWELQLPKLRSSDVYVENNIMGHVSATEGGPQGDLEIAAWCAPETRLNMHANNLTFDTNTGQNFDLSSKDLMSSNYAETPRIIDRESLQAGGRAIGSATDGGNVGVRYSKMPTRQQLFDDVLDYDWSDEFVPQAIPLHPNDADFAPADKDKDFRRYFGKTIGKLEITWNGGICYNGDKKCDCADNFDDTCPQAASIPCGGDSVEISEGTLQSAKAGNMYRSQSFGCVFQESSSNFMAQFFPADQYIPDSDEGSFTYPECSLTSGGGRPSDQDEFAQVEWANAFNENSHVITFNLVKNGTTEEIILGSHLGTPGRVEDDCVDDNNMDPECQYYTGSLGIPAHWTDVNGDGVAEVPPYNGYFKILLYNMVDNPEEIVYEEGDKIIMRHFIPIGGADSYTGLG